MRRGLPTVRTLCCALMVVALPATSSSCGSCEINCSGTPDVEARLDGFSVGTRVEVCLNDDCQVVASQDFGVPGEPIAALPIADGQFQPNEKFDLRLTLLDGNGATVGTISERRSFSKSGCTCLGFAYRWVDDHFERWG
jgi:hypothetical protein